MKRNNGKTAREARSTFVSWMTTDADERRKRQERAAAESIVAGGTDPARLLSTPISPIARIDS